MLGSDDAVSVSFPVVSADCELARRAVDARAAADARDACVAKLTAARARAAAAALARR